MCGEGGVIAAAVLHMKNERHIKHLSLKLGVFSVGTQKRENNLGCRHRRIGVMNVKALVAQIMIVSVIAVNREHREH